MEVWLVWIIDLDVMGHIFPEKENEVHYVIGRVSHTSTIKKNNYNVVEKIKISKEDV